MVECPVSFNDYGTLKFLRSKRKNCEPRRFWGGGGGRERSDTRPELNLSSCCCAVAAAHRNTRTKGDPFERATQPTQHRSETARRQRKMAGYHYGLGRENRYLSGNASSGSAAYGGGMRSTYSPVRTGVPSKKTFDFFPLRPRHRCFVKIFNLASPSVSSWSEGKSLNWKKNVNELPSIH